MDLKDFIKNIVMEAETKIITLATSELENTDKKQKLDETILDYVQKYIDAVQVNFIVKMVLKRVIVPLVPTVTQLIYDLLKTKIQGITK